MKIVKFDTTDGFYLTKTNSINTELHSHPAIELIFAEANNFSLKVSGHTFSNIKFAIVDSNVLHQLNFDSSTVSILLIENKDNSVKNLLEGFKINLSNGFYYESSGFGHAKIEQIFNTLIKKATDFGYDSRVLKAINFMDDHVVTYKTLLNNLLKETGLSESRLSHLFKQNTGISMKKYFVWSKLKKVVKMYLYERQDLFSAMIKCGFYDQAHFSKSYKSMIGVNPSKIYNSRILQ